MEYIYSAMLLHSAGKEIDEKNVKKVIEAAGVKAEDAKIKAMIAALEGVDIEEVVSKAAVPVATAAAPAASGGAEAKEEEKEEEDEEDEEKKAEEAAGGLASLFG
ncbi:MAG: 50S ribosomal protein P1 [Candidatus Aenigmarchaeota archaeon]|nr:50S ribosomal protein P1 [Candidatus Aenigmarchaeota archaeon]